MLTVLRGLNLLRAMGVGLVPALWAVTVVTAVTTDIGAQARDISPPLPARHPNTPITKIVAKAPGVEFSAPKAADAKKTSAMVKPRSPLDKTLEPLTSFKVSNSDIKRLKAAFKLIYKGDMIGAIHQRSEIENPVAKKLITWYRLRAAGSEASANDIEKFRKANPDWPDQRRLRKRAEEAIFKSAKTADEVIAFFTDNPPQYAAGKAALAKAYLELGKEEKKAIRLIRSSWRDHDLDNKTESAIAKEFKKQLDVEDHKWRLDRFLLNDSRYGRPLRLARAKRAMKYLTGNDKKIAEIRLTIWRSYSKRRRSARLNAAARLIKKLPKDIGEDWGLYYHKIQMTRRKGKHELAWKMLIDAPIEVEKIHFPDHWWVERRVNAYDALYRKKPDIAYQIVSKTGPLSVNERNESAFMSGWIALRFLNRPEQALKHFQALSKSADGPRSTSRGAYWQARALKTLGRDAEAKTYFQKAAKNFNTFYGQLARQTLDPDDREIAIKPPEMPPQSVVDDFLKHDGLKALMIVHQARNRNIMRRFLHHYRRHFITEHEMVLAAHLAKSLGDTQMAVRTGKTGMGRGFNLVHYAYPVHAFPKFKPLRPSPEKAMLYALARQESEFNTLITSIAGARGVLQVMGVTARHVCRDYKIRCGSRHGPDRHGAGIQSRPLCLSGPCLPQIQAAPAIAGESHALRPGPSGKRVQYADHEYCRRPRRLAGDGGDSAPCLPRLQDKMRLKAWPQAAAVE